MPSPAQPGAPSPGDEMQLTRTPLSGNIALSNAELVALDTVLSGYVGRLCALGRLSDLGEAKTLRDRVADLMVASGEEAAPGDEHIFHYESESEREMLTEALEHAQVVYQQYPVVQALTDTVLPQIDFGG